jgi:hypothetical protein
MENKPGTLDTLKKWLDGSLPLSKKQVKEPCNQLQVASHLSHISTGKPIPAEKEEWFNHGGGNLVDEVYALRMHQISKGLMVCLRTSTITPNLHHTI